MLFSASRTRSDANNRQGGGGMSEFAGEGKLYKASVLCSVSSLMHAAFRIGQTKFTNG